MTDAHKAALARGRAEGRTVRQYLEAVKLQRPRRGRQRTPESMKKRLVALGTELFTADALTELKLLQERRDLESELQSRSEPVDQSALEKAFVAVAASYGERQGITYATWREIGVEAAVLKKAGITRAS